MRYTSQLVASILGLDSENIRHNEISNFSIDSRTVINGANVLFFAITGKNHNGHDFIVKLYERGVRNFVISEEGEFLTQCCDANYYRVENVVEALQALARYHRLVSTAQVIAVTGSNGKTVVKEWLAQALSEDVDLYRSPGSYNSQVGVPLALLGIEDHHQLAIIEAGISKPNEMALLESMIAPNVAIFTHLGDAHNENFQSKVQKLEEKGMLFRHVETIIGQESEVLRKIIELRENPVEVYSWSSDLESGAAVLVKDRVIDQIRLLELSAGEKSFNIDLPYIDEASFINAMHVITVMLWMGFDTDCIIDRISHLQAVAMRLEIKKGAGGSILIHDYYNSDLASFSIALGRLVSVDRTKISKVVLSDFIGIGQDARTIYKGVVAHLKEHKIESFVGIGEQLFTYQELFREVHDTKFYKTTDEFLLHERRKEYSNKVVLLKGARIFRFERIAVFLQQQSHNTILEVDLDAMTHNLNYFRGLVPSQTKTAVMVKAFSYGSGSGEIASHLQYQGVDYLMVAYIDEGVELRKAGIVLPIAVMNPDLDAMDLLLEYELEPEIYSIDFLERYCEAIKESRFSSTSIHLKINTGMNRSGIDDEEVEQVLERLKRYDIKIASVFTHLAAADEAVYDWFTREQLDIFDRIATRIVAEIGYRPLLHVLNSAGIERFTEYHYDMVRLGIGLHGISVVDAPLVPVSSFKTYIASKREVEDNVPIGYGLKGRLDGKRTIAVLPVGYADGWNRLQSCGVGEVWIRGQRAKIVGNICMDACMIDVTGIDVEVGDVVEIFGKEISVVEVARRQNTIPYEVLTSISPRVKRLYFRDN